MRLPHNPEAVGSNPSPAKVLSGQDEIETFLAYLRGDASTLLAAADLDGDETIQMDKTELEVAEWIDRDDLTEEDDGVSITREMMSYFKNHKELSL